MRTLSPCCCPTPGSRPAVTPTPGASRGLRQRLDRRRGRPRRLSPGPPPHPRHGGRLRRRGRVCRAHPAAGPPGRRLWRGRRGARRPDGVARGPIRVPPARRAADAFGPVSVFDARTLSSLAAESRDVGRDPHHPVVLGAVAAAAELEPRGGGHGSRLRGRSPGRRRRRCGCSAWTPARRPRLSPGLARDRSVGPGRGGSALGPPGRPLASSPPTAHPRRTSSQRSTSIVRGGSLPPAPAAAGHRGTGRQRQDGPGGRTVPGLRQLGSTWPS